MKLLNDWSHSRRAFLKATGLGAAMLPVLHAERKAHAAGAPRRVLIIVSANGWVHDTFVPKGSSGSLASMTLPEGTSTFALDGIQTLKSGFYLVRVVLPSGKTQTIKVSKR